MFTLRALIIKSIQDNKNAIRKKSIILISVIFLYIKCYILIITLLMIPNLRQEVIYLLTINNIRYLNAQEISRARRISSHCLK